MTGQGPPASLSVRSVDLTPAQEIAVRVLVASGSIAQAAQAADVTERSVRRWLEDAAFRGSYRAAGRAAASEAVTALLAAQCEAVAALRAALTVESAVTRVRAARALLEVGRHALEDDFDERLMAMESEVKRWHSADHPGPIGLPA